MTTAVEVGVDALVVEPEDNVATALRALDAGPVHTNGGPLDTSISVPAGHKIATRLIRSGEHVVKYGEPVGVALVDIAPGDLVHVHNTGNILPATRPANDAERESMWNSVVPRLPRQATWDAAALSERDFFGFRRSDGTVGIRNEVLILSTVGCANVVADRIARATGTVSITHQQGCLQLGTDLELTEKQLAGAANNPNVGAVVLAGLGCETMQVARLLERIQGKPVASVTIQQEGGTRKAVERGSAFAAEFRQEVDRAQRNPFPVSRLIVGTKCGGSDALSGLTANPATGIASDMLVDAGAAVLLSETPGLYGSEPFLAARMVVPGDRHRLAAALDRMWEESLRLGEPMSEGEMSPGNVEGGLTTLVEKSLGATTKAGTRPIRGFLEFADRVPGPGLWIMDTPGFDIITISGQAAGGAQLILFTTGRGSPVGCAIAPTIKIASNSQIYDWMEEDIDVNAGSVVTEGRSLEAVGQEIFDLVIAVANGQPSKAEEQGHREFALARIGSTL